MTNSEQELKQYLEALLAIGGSLPNGYAYKSPFDFLVQHGKMYKPRSRPKGIRAGAPRCCFANALMAAIKYNWTYVEGYAMAIIPVHHGWNIDQEGRLVDVTWEDGVGLAYCGVEFSIGRADDAGWNGDATVLEDWKRDYPILKQPWTGEDFAKEWPESFAVRKAKRLMRRTNSKQSAKSV